MFFDSFFGKISPKLDQKESGNLIGSGAWLLIEPLTVIDVFEADEKRIASEEI